MSSLLTIMIPQTWRKPFSFRSQAELHGFKSIRPLSGNGYWALQQPNSQLPRGSSLQKQRGWYRQLEYDGGEASKSKPRCPYGIPELKRKLRHQAASLGQCLKLRPRESKDLVWKHTASVMVHANCQPDRTQNFPGSISKCTCGLDYVNWVGRGDAGVQLTLIFSAVRTPDVTWCHLFLFSQIFLETPTQTHLEVVLNPFRL